MIERGFPNPFPFGSDRHTREHAKRSGPALRRLSFRRGFVMTARFAPDGSVIYGAAWEDEPLQLYSSYPGNPESRPLGLTNTDILAISRQGDLAVSLGRHYEVGWVRGAACARRTWEVPRQKDQNEAEDDDESKNQTLAGRVLESSCCGGLCRSDRASSAEVEPQ